MAITDTITIPITVTHRATLRLTDTTSEDLIWEGITALLNPAATTANPTGAHRVITTTT